MSVEPRLLDLKEVATCAHVSYQTALDWILSGELPDVSLPGRRENGEGGRPKRRRKPLVDRVDLNIFIENHKEREALR